MTIWADQNTDNASAQQIAISVVNLLATRRGEDEVQQRVSRRDPERPAAQGSREPKERVYGCIKA